MSLRAFFRGDKEYQAMIANDEKFYAVITQKPLSDEDLSAMEIVAQTAGMVVVSVALMGVVAYLFMDGTQQLLYTDAMAKNISRIIAYLVRNASTLTNSVGTYFLRLLNGTVTIYNSTFPGALPDATASGFSGNDKSANMVQQIIDVAKKIVKNENEDSGNFILNYVLPLLADSSVLMSTEPYISLKPVDKYSKMRNSQNLSMIQTYINNDYLSPADIDQEKVRNFKKLPMLMFFINTLLPSTE